MIENRVNCLPKILDKVIFSHCFFVIWWKIEFQFSNQRKKDYSRFDNEAKFGSSKSTKKFPLKQKKTFDYRIEIFSLFNF
jgi:hypothetical protein